ncbi:protease modulator HflC (plasmid) [Aliivibrio salmonicida]|uniref:protease modulator HflC n=1 Tax=Aliivibrio salmonicida TaxID=40269 RepID=UPI000F70DED2|nr:protease modulator HflC [Aliivibrio salmonicida]AZL83360.1 protease modulator HflC [Aliivibrio salmonicida]
MRTLNNTSIVILLLLALTLIFKNSFTFTVYENNIAFLTTFSKLKTDEHGEPIVYGPGLHFKNPAVDNVIEIPKRKLLLQVEDDRFVTVEKKDVILDYYATWRIADNQKYFLATKGADKAIAELMMERKIGDAMRSVIGKHKLLEVSTGAIDAFVGDSKSESNSASTAEVKPTPGAVVIIGKREAILDTILLNVKGEIMEDLGIELIDVRYKTLELPKTILKSIYDRMKAERNSVANSFRSNGTKKADQIKSTADERVASLLSAADESVRITRGKAEAKASEIYSNAYSADPKFYTYYKSLQSYKEAFAPSEKGTLMIISKDSPYFDVMYNK